MTQTVLSCLGTVYPIEQVKRQEGKEEDGKVQQGCCMPVINDWNLPSLHLRPLPAYF
jgi:hypothetical protein